MTRAKKSAAPEKSGKEYLSEQMRSMKKRLFIEVTERLLCELEFSQVTIRRIADAAGYNSATIYNYFEDLDELLLYASFKFRREYLLLLSGELRPDMTSLEQFICAHRVYISYAFRAPELFFNFLYGRYSYGPGKERRKAIAEDYYAMFPDEQLTPEGIAYDVTIRGDVYESMTANIRRLAEDGYVKPENVGMVVELLNHVQKSILYDMCKYPEFGQEALERAFLEMFTHILHTN